jgi:hypothetical protein
VRVVSSHWVEAISIIAGKIATQKRAKNTRLFSQSSVIARPSAGGFLALGRSNLHHSWQDCHTKTGEKHPFILAMTTVD